LLACALSNAALARAAEHAACPDGNVLAGRAPLVWYAVYKPDRVTDGIAAREGDPADVTLSAIFSPEAAFVVYDLGAPTPIRALVLQADADDGYRVDGSEDAARWIPIWDAGPVADAQGMVTRSHTVPGGEHRYLRLTANPGHGVLAVAELQAFCVPPLAPAAGLRIMAAHPEVPFRFLVEQQARRKVALGILALAEILLIGRMQRRETRRTALAALLLGGAAAALAFTWTFGPLGALPVTLMVAFAALAPWLAPGCTRLARPGSTTGMSLVLLATAAACAFPIFGAARPYRSVHWHDAAHYFLGAKYAPELGYENLYRCAAVAELQEERWPIAPQRRVRDLRTNELVPFRSVAENPGACTWAFTSERWDAFRRDVVFFQSQLGPQLWAEVLTDRGYNATPAWTWLWNAFILRDRPADIAWVESLSHIDEVLYLLMFPLVLWGFGLEGGTLALLVLGLGFPWYYLWTGGGLGRSLWLVCTVAAVCFLRKGAPVLAGVALGAAAALQAFPALLLAGPALGLLAGLVRERALDACAAKLLAAAGVTVVLLLGASIRVEGIGAYADFLQNTAKHVSTPSANRLGLPMLLDYLSGRSARAAVLSPAGATALFWAGLAAFGVLFGYATLRVRTVWARLALSVLILLAVFELSSYYLAVLMCLAPIAVVRLRRSVVLLASVVATQIGVLVVQQTPVHGFYAVVSAGALLLAGYLLVDVGLSPSTNR
jgi:hypothetical protein